MLIEQRFRVPESRGEFVASLMQEGTYVGLTLLCLAGWILFGMRGAW